MRILNIKEWGIGIDTSRKVLIAGPCSAETEVQVQDSFEGAAIAGAQLFRAGIWKPRTRPDSFEGVGEIGLPWIMKAAAKHQLPVTVEVAKPSHVEAALKAGVHVLWIGARTTVNPFAVQDIVDSLVGVDIPVMIKNPINPDVELWIGAIERFMKKGHLKLAAIHRGFSVSNAQPYRNLPMWALPIELKRRYPQMEIICDPSHIAGNRALIPELAQKALDLEFSGWMIETHSNPSKAWSDAKQQVTGSELKNLLSNLIHRDSSSSNPEFVANLEALRYDIDKLDEEVIQMLGKRMEVVREIGKYKDQAGITILQMDRWKRIFDQRIQATLDQDLSQSFAEQFIRALHEESIRQQNAIMNQLESSRES